MSTKRKAGRPRGGKYPKAIRDAWMEYKRLQRQTKKENQRIARQMGFGTRVKRTQKRKAKVRRRKK